MRDCPRCHKTHYNSFTIRRYREQAQINKCCVCGFLWIFDEDLITLAKAESKKFFIDTLKNMGKDGSTPKRKGGN